MWFTKRHSYGFPYDIKIIPLCAVSNNFIFFRFFNEIGIACEVCHVDPTGSLESTGFKTKSPAKKPIKTSASPRKRSPTKQSDIVEDDNHSKDNKTKIKPRGKRGRK